MSEQVGNEITEKKSVRQHFVHSIKPRDQVIETLGVIEGEARFGRFYLAVSPFIDLLESIEVNLNRKRFKTDKTLNPITLNRIRKIWYGTTYMIVVRDPDHREIVLRRDIAYEKVLLKPNEEEKLLPTLRNLNPIDHIKDETMFIRIREPMNNEDAFDRNDYKSATLYGGLTYNYSEGRKPQFKTEAEFRNSIGQSLSISRSSFHAYINFLHFHFGKNMFQLIADIDEILEDDLKNSFHDTQEERITPDFSNELD